MIFDLGLMYVAFNYTIGILIGLVFAFFCALIVYVIFFWFFGPKPKTPEEYSAEMEEKMGRIAEKYGE